MSEKFRSVKNKTISEIDFLTIEGKPKSQLTSLCNCALFAKGYCGPPYSLDDISSFCTIEVLNKKLVKNSCIDIRFYDMSSSICYRDKYYKDLVCEINKYLKKKNK